jgi:hypothetical protein
MFDLASLNIAVTNTGVDQNVTDLQRLEDAAQKAEQASRQLGNASGRAKRYGTQVNKAAQQTGNLTAQLNDIGVMLAAGQNPLQLAIQQGTQINQVFDQLGGGRSALGAIGAAFRQMLSPVNLVTLGIIAGGAALLQWGVRAYKAGRDTRSFNEVLEETDKLMNEYIKLVQSSSEFGASGFSEARKELQQSSQAYKDLLAIAKIETLNGIAAATNSLADSVLSYSYSLGQVGDTGDLLGIETQLQGNITVWRENREQVNLFIDAIENLSNAASLDEQYAAALSLREEFVSIVDISGDMTERQIEFWKSLSLSIQQMELMGAAVEANAMAAANAIADAERIVGQEMLSSIRAREELQEQANSKAREMLKTSTDQARIAVLTTQHGKDSVQVRAEEVAISRAVYAERVRELGVSQELEQALMGAWDQARALEEVAIAESIAAAKTEAQLLAENLGIALNTAISLLNLQESLQYSGRGSDPRSFGDNSGNGGPTAAAERIQKQIDAFNGGRSSGSGSGGGSKSAVDEYRDELEALQDSLRTEREIRMEWHEEALALANDRRAKELLTEQEHKDLLLEINARHSTDLIELKMQEAEQVRNAQRSMYGELGSLVGQFASKSKAAAVIQIGINTYLRATEAAQNTAAATVRALAELGPIAGPPAAAKIAAYGKLQVAAIIAGGAIRAGSALSGSNGSSGGGGGGGLVSDETQNAGPIRILVEDINPDAIYSGKQFISLVEKVQDEFNNRGVNFTFTQ